MKNTTIDALLIVIIFVIFVGYFTIKGTVEKKMEFNKNMNRIELYAEEGQWNKAQVLAEHFEKEWERYRVVFVTNYAEAEFSLFEESLSYIITGSKAKDLQTVLSHIKIAEGLWENFNRIVPEP